jgi:SAM-dependent methyltransferase
VTDPDPVPPAARLPGAWPRLADRASGAEGIYRGNAERFTGPPSRFYQWAFGIFRERFSRGQVLELGCGTGRDARGFAAAGFQVTAVDYSALAIERARHEIANPPSIRFQRNDALSALRDTLTASLDAVYAHAVYMMLPEEELVTVIREVRRVLHPGGLHLYAVRSVTDPIAGEGQPVAPDVWRRSPGAAPYRFFRRETIDALTAEGFERLALDFPEGLHFWYVADRRP